MKSKNTYESLFRLEINPRGPETMHVCPIVYGRHRLLGLRTGLSNKLYLLKFFNSN